MKIAEFVNSSWSLHASNPQQVLEDVKKQFNYIETEEEILSLTHLIVHVSGEHLGKWQEGLELLKKLKNNTLLKNKTEMNRYVAILELGNNPYISIEHFSPSDQARILSTTAAALNSLGGVKTSESFLRKAEVLALSLPKEDPANRNMAANCNGIASSLERKQDREPKATELMIYAAKQARVFWERAGTWLEVERAEYRLAHSYLKAGENDQALIHANNCFKIITDNNSIPLELFFALEAKALIYTAKADTKALESTISALKTAFEALSPEDKTWCEVELKKLV